MTISRVLVVEDEPSLRNLVERYLARQGYQVEGSGSAEEAVRTIAGSPARFELFLVDVTLPGRSGLDLARAILTSQPDARILLMSGYACDSDQVDPQRTGRVGYLPKPFLPNQLADAVQALASRSL